jgi:hypothetical protein
MAVRQAVCRGYRGRICSVSRYPIPFTDKLVRDLFDRNTRPNEARHLETTGLCRPPLGGQV